VISTAMHASSDCVHAYMPVGITTSRTVRSVAILKDINIANNQIQSSQAAGQPGRGRPSSRRRRVVIVLQVDEDAVRRALADRPGGR